ncbi:MAG: TraB domain-containing protein [Candidatus Thorarchaeota archaeon]
MTTELDRIHFVAVIHVDQDSVDDARQIVKQVEPDVVAVELDKHRYNQLMQDDDAVQEPPTNQMNAAEGFLNQIALLERSLGQLTGSGAGEEMKAAIEEGRKIDAKIALVDRPLGEIMNSLSKVPLDEIYRFASMVPDLDNLQLKQGDFDLLSFLKEESTIPEMMEQFRTEFPELTEVLIDERDEYVAEALEFILRDVDGQVVVILGAGHIKGVKEKLAKILETNAAA